VDTNQEFKDLILDKCLISEGGYLISDGSVVDTFVDFFQVLLHPQYSWEVIPTVTWQLKKRLWHTGSIAGRETCGAILASRVSASLYIPTLVIRKDSDKIEGPGGPKSCVLVDDVTSAGVSMEDSVLKLRDSGYEVIGALSVVYRGRGADKVASRLGIPFEWLVYHPE